MGVVHRLLVQRYEYFAFRSGVAPEQGRNIEAVSICSIQFQDPVFQFPPPCNAVRPFKRAPFPDDDRLLHALSSSICVRYHRCWYTSYTS